MIRYNNYRLNEVRGVSVTTRSTIFLYAKYIATYIKSPFGLADDLFHHRVSDDKEFTIKELIAYHKRLYYDEYIEEFKDVLKLRPEWSDNIVFVEEEYNENYTGYYLNTFVHNGEVHGRIGYVNDDADFDDIVSTLVHEFTHAYQKLRNYEANYSPYRPMYNASKHMATGISALSNDYKGKLIKLVSYMKDYKKCKSLLYGSYYYADPREIEAFMNTMYTYKELNKSNRLLYYLNLYTLLYDFWDYIADTIEDLNHDILDELENNYFNNILHSNILDQEKLLYKVANFYKKIFSKVLKKIKQLIYMKIEDYTLR